MTTLSWLVDSGQENRIEENSSEKSEPQLTLWWIFAADDAETKALLLGTFFKLDGEERMGGRSDVFG